MIAASGGLAKEPTVQTKTVAAGAAQKQTSAVQSKIDKLENQISALSLAQNPTGNTVLWTTGKGTGKGGQGGGGGYTHKKSKGGAPKGRPKGTPKGGAFKGRKGEKGGWKGKGKGKGKGQGRTKGGPGHVVRQEFKRTRGWDNSKYKQPCAKCGMKWCTGACKFYNKQYKKAGYNDNNKPTKRQEVALLAATRASAEQSARAKERADTGTPAAHASDAGGDSR